MTTATACGHKAGYRLVDGELRCSDCGAASQSSKWQENVYGVEMAKMMPAPENKMAEPAENKGNIWPAAQKRLRGRPKFSNKK